MTILAFSIILLNVLVTILYGIVAYVIKEAILTTDIPRWFHALVIAIYIGGMYGVYMMWVSGLNLIELLQ